MLWFSPSASMAPCLYCCVGIQLHIAGFLIITAHKQMWKAAKIKDSVHGVLPRPALGPFILITLFSCFCMLLCFLYASDFLHFCNSAWYTGSVTLHCFCSSVISFYFARWRDRRVSFARYYCPHGKTWDSRSTASTVTLLCICVCSFWYKTFFFKECSTNTFIYACSSWLQAIREAC